VQYRIYQLGADGRIRAGVDFDCANDEAAIEAPKQFVGGCDVEVWQGSRLVALLEAPKG
jgi:hypothetical protein